MSNDEMLVRMTYYVIILSMVDKLEDPQSQKPCYTECSLITKDTWKFYLYER